MPGYVSEQGQGTGFEISYEQLEYFHKQNLREAKRGQRMTESSYRGENYWDRGDNFHAALDQEYLLRDPLTAGMRIEYPHGVVLRQSARSSFFRGENRLYDCSVPTLLRKLSTEYGEDEAGQALYRMVADMRIYEFKCLIEQFDHVAGWSQSDVLYDVLAQHYGLETCWMDMTSDFDVALFFAACYYDSKEKAWKPLTRAQTEQNEKTKYGVIYHMPGYVMGGRWDMELQKFSGCSDEIVEYREDGNRYRLYEHPEYQGPVQNLIYPIGFQPFMRCSMQNGYAIYMRDFQPLQGDRGFQRLRFRHSEELSERIYEYMDKGAKIYPHEGLNEVQFLIDQIAGETNFSYDAFRYALYRSHEYSLAMEEECRKRLQQFAVDGKKITIGTDSAWRLSSGRRRKINREHEDFSLQKEYHIFPVERRVIPAGASVFAPYMLMGKAEEPGVVDFRAREMSGCTNLWTISSLRMLHTLMYAEAPQYM